MPEFLTTLNPTASSIIAVVVIVVVLIVGYFVWKYMNEKWPFGQ